MKGNVHSSLILLNVKILILKRSKQLVSYFEHTKVDSSETERGNVTRMEDIYKDDWRELVEESIEKIDESKKLFLHVDV